MIRRLIDRIANSSYFPYVGYANPTEDDTDEYGFTEAEFQAYLDSIPATSGEQIG